MNNDIRRCGWCLCDPIMMEYHDQEWGDPVHDDQKHFEFLTLEVMQAGLNWLMILKKRNSMRTAFDGFDYRKIANYDEKKVEELLSNPGIIKSRKKIEAVINNAKIFIQIQKEYNSFDNYIWGFTNYRTVIEPSHGKGQIPATTELSDIISKDLRKRGFLLCPKTIICWQFCGC